LAIILFQSSEDDSQSFLVLGAGRLAVDVH